MLKLDVDKHSNDRPFRSRSTKVDSFHCQPDCKHDIRRQWRLGRLEQDDNNIRLIMTERMLTKRCYHEHAWRTPTTRSYDASFCFISYLYFSSSFYSLRVISEALHGQIYHFQTDIVYIWAHKNKQCKYKISALNRYVMLSIVTGIMEQTA